VRFLPRRRVRDSSAPVRWVGMVAQALRFSEVIAHVRGRALDRKITSWIWVRGWPAGAGAGVCPDRAQGQLG